MHINLKNNYKTHIIMGYNMHVRTKNRIEYGRGLFSADTSNEVILIIRLYFGNDVYSNDSDTLFEIPRADFLSGIQKVKNIKKFNTLFPNIISSGYDKEKFVSTLQEIYDTADPDNEEIALDWF